MGSNRELRCWARKLAARRTAKCASAFAYLPFCVVGFNCLFFVCVFRPPCVTKSARCNSLSRVRGAPKLQRRILVFAYRSVWGDRSGEPQFSPREKRILAASPSSGKADGREQVGGKCRSKFPRIFLPFFSSIVSWGVAYINTYGHSRKQERALS